jgi:hypothetical protein
MAIEPEIHGKPSNQWYMTYSNLARTWNQVIETLGGKCKGKFNHYMLEFEASYRTRLNQKVFIKGSTHFKNTSSGVGKIASFSEKLEIIIDGKNQPNSFLLTSNKWLLFKNHLFGPLKEKVPLTNHFLLFVKANTINYEELDLLSKNFEFYILEAKHKRLSFKSYKLMNNNEEIFKLLESIQRLAI